MKMAAIAIVFLGCLTFAGCALVPSFRPAPTPHADQVRRIRIDWGTGFAERDAAIPRPRSAIIEDRVQIAKITEFITAHAYGWREPWHTLPNREYFVVLEGDGESAFAFYVIGDSIGGQVGGKQMLRKLSNHDMRELRELLGIPRERPSNSISGS
jgi:hypothetical protein